MEQINSEALAEWVRSEITRYGQRGLARRITELTKIPVSQASIRSWASGKCKHITENLRNAIMLYREISETEFVEWLRPDRKSRIDEAIALINRGLTMLKDCTKLGENPEVGADVNEYLGLSSKKYTESDNMARSLVAALIAQVMSANKVSLKRISVLSGLSQQRLQEILDKKINPTDIELAGLANALDSQKLRVTYDFLKNLKNLTEKDACKCEADDALR